MVMPKGYLTNINIQNQKIGFPRRQEILDDIADKGTFLPRGVLIEDMDGALVEYLEDKNGLSISIEGEKVPVFFLTIQRWTEFTKTWQFTDKYKTMNMPFITIVRKPDIQQGQNQAGLWNIPMNHTYTYMKVPTFDGIRRGVDLYKIPQPTSVDLTYEVRIFTGKMKDLNKFNEKIQKTFQSRQSYLNINGHPMPLHLESIGDESNIEDFENKRFYVQMFEMKLLGYILDEEDFEVIPTLNRAILSYEIIEGIKSKVLVKQKNSENCVNFKFDFKPSSSNSVDFVSNYSVSFNLLTKTNSILNIIIVVNNISVFDGINIVEPIIFNQGDNITIMIERPNNNSEAIINLIGNTI
jgi:hypothetical protein